MGYTRQERLQLHYLQDVVKLERTQNLCEYHRPLSPLPALGKDLLHRLAH